MKDEEVCYHCENCTCKEEKLLKVLTDPGYVPPDTPMYEVYIGGKRYISDTPYLVTEHGKTGECTLGGFVCAGEWEK